MFLSACVFLFLIKNPHFQNEFVENGGILHGAILDRLISNSWETICI